MILQKSLKELARTKNPGHLKFWGKIKGTQKDYFVVEGSLEAGEPAEGDGPQGEPRGTGVNKFVYWVASAPNGPWTELPDLKPSQIIAARGIKHTFTGNLDSKIFTNPFYFDTEKIYLRAQIARISSHAILIPKGLYKLNEENPREVEENVPEEGELVKPTVQQMAQLDMWVHFNQSILRQGTTKHAEPKPGPGQEEMEPEELMKIEIAKDPWDERLKPVVNDAKSRGGMPAWLLRSYDADQQTIDAKSG